jgi:hypothetical protein
LTSLSTSVSSFPKVVVFNSSFFCLFECCLVFH